MYYFNRKWLTEPLEFHLEGADDYSIHLNIVKLQLFCHKRSKLSSGKPASGETLAELVGRLMEPLQPKMISLIAKIFINMMTVWDFCPHCKNLRNFKHYNSQGRNCSTQLHKKTYNSASNLNSTLYFIKYNFILKNYICI